ncbi:MAG: hypothetical protein COZ91_00505 [Candidatus Nealsonbacteria bacterium CG_4_8_14_3_um_filter_39_7]|nr:MAG: hypothetical protein COZ91_00505 [Candidatus Nealsonbacteria bacterium CG_4_8_14_3_um_filter_39_7]
MSSPATKSEKPCGGGGIRPVIRPGVGSDDPTNSQALSSAGFFRPLAEPPASGGMARPME